MTLLFNLVIAGLLVIASTSRAHAYLDAGSGSMLVQLLFGGVAGLLVLLKLYWHRLRVFLGLAVEPTGAISDAHADGSGRDRH
jgi:hypothetical protein